MTTARPLDRSENDDHATDKRTKKAAARKTSKWEDANEKKLKKIRKLKTSSSPVECTFPQSAIKGLADVAPSRARPRKEWKKGEGEQRKEEGRQLENFHLAAAAAEVEGRGKTGGAFLASIVRPLRTMPSRAD